MLFPPWEEAEKASFKGDQPSPDSKSVVTLIMVSEASRTSVHRVMPLRTFSGGWRDDPVVQSPCCSSKAPGFGSHHSYQAARPPPVIPVPADPAPSSGPADSGMQRAHTHMLRHKYVHIKSTFKNVFRLRCFVIAAVEGKEIGSSSGQSGGQEGEHEEPMALPGPCIFSPSTAYIMALLLPSALYCSAGNGT